MTTRFNKRIAQAVLSVGSCVVVILGSHKQTSLAADDLSRVKVPPPHAVIPHTVNSQIDRLNPAVDEIVPANATVEQIATGFTFVEGPVWFPAGYLLFSDTRDNVIYKWTPNNQLTVLRQKSGYSGNDLSSFREAGSNGLTMDREGRLTINELGNRRVTRLEKDGHLTVLADSYQGKRLNSPNDLVYKSDGSLYCTDPPFGLLKSFDDPKKELPFSGVFRVANGQVYLVSRDLTGPNGLAFSPDEKYFYVDNWNVDQRIVMRYVVNADGTLSRGRVFIDMADAPEVDQAPDGMKVDRKGNLYVAGPGGVWIVSPVGKHLGTIRLPELPSNMAWGDADGRTLYLTARTGLYRIQLKLPGIRPYSSIRFR